MASKRVITSNIWEDEFFGNLDMMGRLLWIGIFSRCADDQGRLVDNPIVIRSQVFPYDDIPVNEIDKRLNLFAVEGKIIRYGEGRKRFIQIVRWWENQTPQWAMPSNYPPPDGWTDKVRSYIKGVYHVSNWPAKNPPKEDKPDSPGDTPGGESSLPPQVDEHEINPEINPDPIENRDAGASRLSDKLIHTYELEKYFLVKTGLKAPKRHSQTEIKEWNILWGNPIKEILELTECDVGAAQDLIDKAIGRLNGLTVSDPKSIIKTVRALCSTNGNGERKFLESY